MVKNKHLLFLDNESLAIIQKIVLFVFNIHLHGKMWKTENRITD